MLRFGDLTDVHIVTSQREAFADEHRLPNFVVRSNLPATTKAPEERLVKTALEIAERVQRAIEDKQDTTKYADVEIRPSQVIERLYENLKLRVAVQRALRDARYTKNDDKGAYVLVAKQADLPTLGIPRDFPPWFWAEKEHDWTSKKDTALLLGIYVHGFGAWEDILNDDLLHFHSQRALKGERMKKRAENLLKRLPPPDESAGEPRIVHLANALVTASSQPPGQSLGAVFNAIINNSSSSSGATVVANPNSVGGSSSNALANKGRLHRAAERFAARQSSSSSSSASASAQQQSRVVPEDSIRRTHTQSSSSSSSGLGDRHRKASITSPAIASTASVATAPSYSDDEPEDGEVDVAPAPSSSPTNSHSSSSSKRPLPSSSSSSSNSKPATKRRSASTERSSSSSSKRSASPRKRSKSSGERTSSSSHKSKSKSKTPSSSTPVPPSSSQIPKAPVVLSPDACVDKWKPSKRLKAIRQVLKKMKIMETWSTNQKDEVVVEKVYKYVTTIGDAIDAIVVQAERESDAHEWDELCSCLWAYAAGYTPFSSVTFERLYDDICADGDALRLAAAVETSRRPSAAST